MKRVKKEEDSLIIEEKLAYIKGDNSRIAEILKREQNNICAYTEEYLGRADKAEIEHFNPTYKYTIDDGYQNWFLVKAQWNNEKGSKARWLKYQPLLHPTAQDFQKRILYENGLCVLADENDIEAGNLRSYLKLDDEELAKQRVYYIQRMKDDIALSELTSQEFVDWRLSSPKYSGTIYYIRALEEELNVKVDFDLLKTR